MRDKFWSRVSNYSNIVSMWVGYIGVIGIIVGRVSQFFEWGDKWLFSYLKDNMQWIWLVTITAFLITLWYRISRLNKRFVQGFKDNFTGDLRKNWDFTGEWRFVEKGVLMVTESHRGGLTKAGAYWENYTLKFKAFIMNKCLGVIVRAQDLNNYYMFQIRKDKIRPHRLVALPVLEKKSSKKTSDETPDDFIIKYNLAWQLFDDYNVDIAPPLNDWFDVKLTVRGESVFLYINNELILQQESFLKIPCGKVGFRNASPESAKVKNMQVILDV
ncbi:MAG: hypothetical protein ACYSSL_08520 [Planctomycetota bacterium]|jgi:hypothetical protein